MNKKEFKKVLSVTTIVTLDVYYIALLIFRAESNIPFILGVITTGIVFVVTAVHVTLQTERKKKLKRKREKKGAPHTK